MTIYTKLFTRSAMATIWVMPPFKSEGDGFITDVALLDHFGNEHWVRDLEFTYGEIGG
jgi:hypothetical protein